MCYRFGVPFVPISFVPIDAGGTSMADDEIRRALEGAPADAEHLDPELLERFEAGQSLGADIEQRYLDMGVRLLSDDMPRRLDERTQARLERLLGRDLGGVRVHTGERAQRAAGAMGAQAFALGEKDVFFGPGGYDPSSRQGIGLLAHEIAHTVEAGVPGGPQVGFEGRPSESGRGEGFAQETEGRVLAQEDGPAAAAEAEEAGPSPGKAKAPGARGKHLDPNLIEREAWREFLERSRRDLERHGNW